MGEIALLCVFAFFAGLVDAVAGGGGLIQVPALFAVFPGTAPPLLLGTNKLSAITGTSVATYRYSWSVAIPWRAILPAIAIAAGASVIGAETVTLIDPALLRPLLLVILTTMVVYTLARPRLGEVGSHHPKKPDAIFYVVVAAFGFYDGFFGPGAGSVLMFCLVRFFGHDFLSAAATTKVLNLTTNLGALLLFIATGNVLYAVALPMAVFNVMGGFLGAHLAVRRGSRFIRAVFLGVVILLISKVLRDLLKSS